MLISLGRAFYAGGLRDAPHRPLTHVQIGVSVGRVTTERANARFRAIGLEGQRERTTVQLLGG